MGNQQDMVMKAIAGDLRRRRKWDEPPGLYPIYLTPQSARLGLSLAPGNVWRGAAPEDILEALADITEAESDVLRRVAGRTELFAVGFFCETWVAARRLDLSRDVAAQAREFKGMVQAAGGPSRMAGRRETRYMWAVDRHGFTYTACQARGGREIITSVEGPGTGCPDDGRAAVRSLERIVAAMTGVALPPRPHLV